MPTELQTLARAHLIHIINRIRTVNDDTPGYPMAGPMSRVRLGNLLNHTTVEYGTSSGLTLNIGRVAPPYTPDGYLLAQDILDRFTLADVGARRKTARTLRYEISRDGYHADITWEET
jgi:hypothetical protein